MKYKIIPDEVVKAMIDFLDEVQFDAAASQHPEDIQKVNFCNWIINELLTGVDGFDTEDEAAFDRKKKPSKRMKRIKSYRKEFPDDMTKKDFDKLLQQFDAFCAGWDKEYHKSNVKDSAKEVSLKDFEKELKMDRDLTPEEKFELYYDEHSKRKPIEKGISYNKMLKELGIEPASDTKEE